jgi:hypothetical protein
MLRTAHPQFLPRFVCRYSDAVDSPLCVQSRITTPAGAYLSGDAPSAVTLPPFDQTQPRLLPWGGWAVHRPPWFWPVMGTLLAACPVVLAIQKCWRTLGVYALITMVWTVVLAANMLRNDFEFYPEERLVWNGWYEILLSGGLVPTLGLGVWAVLVGLYDGFSKTRTRHL